MRTILIAWPLVLFLIFFFLFLLLIFMTGGKEKALLECQNNQQPFKFRNESGVCNWMLERNFFFLLTSHDERMNILVVALLILYMYMRFFFLF